MFNVFQKRDRHTPEPERKYGLHALSHYVTGGALAAVFIAVFTLPPTIRNAQQIYSVLDKDYTAAGLDASQLEALCYGALFFATGLFFLWLMVGSKWAIVRSPHWFPRSLHIGAGVFFAAWVLLAALHPQASNWSESLMNALFWWVVPFLLFAAPVYWMMGKEWIKETDFYQETFIEGRGQQTSRWAALKTYFGRDLTDWMNASRGGIVRTENSPVYLGRTMWQYDPKLGGRQIGLISEQHLVTVAGTGAGKSRDAISNNMLCYNGGMIAFDTKGEHVRLAYARRRAYAPVYVVDPYGQSGRESDFWNPLHEIDPDSPHARALLTRLAEALIPKEPQERAVDIHFREIPQKIVRGYLAHILTRYPLEKRHLGTLYDLFVKGDIDGQGFDPDAVGKVIKDMAGNDAIGNAPAEAAGILAVLSDRAKSEHYSSISRALDWVNDPLLRQTITKTSTFSIADCKTKDATVFLVFPMRHLKMTARFLGLFYTLALDKLNESETPQPIGSRRRVLMLFDEFEILSSFEPARSAALRARSSNIKCWFVVQNYHQFVGNFGKEKLQDFLGSSDKQFFGVDSTDTELTQMISEALGSYTILEKNPATGEVIRTPENLMSPGAVHKFLNAKRPTQLVIPVHGYPMRLRRVRVGKNFGALFDTSGRRIDTPARARFVQHAENFIQHIKKHIKLELKKRPEQAEIDAAQALINDVREYIFSLDKTMQDIERCKRNVASGRNYEARELAEYEQKLVEYKALQPGYVMGQFKRVVEDSGVKAVLDKFSDAMTPELYRLHHASDVNRIFSFAARVLPPGEIMDMADYIASNDVLRRSAAIDSGYGYARDDIFFGMGELVRRCPLENKLALYAKLEASGYLKDRMPKRKTDDVALFVADAFEGIDTDTAVTVLRSSEAWKAVKKDGFNSPKVRDLP